MILRYLLSGQASTSLGQKIERRFKLFLFMLPIILVSAVLSTAKWVTAQEEDQPVAVSQADFSFGQVMRFSLDLKLEQPVRNITLFISAPELSNTLTTPVHFEGGHEAKAGHDLDLRQVRLAPFTTVTFWWRVEDETGRVFDIEEETISYTDNRYQWQSLEDEIATVHWVGDDSSVGQAALDAVDKALPDIQEIVPVPPRDDLQVFIYPSLEDLQSSLRLTGRNWIGAHARPELGVILVTAGNPRTATVDLGRDIAHELSHLLLYQVTGPAYETVPLWLDEGLATNVEPFANGRFDTVVREAAASGQIIPIAELCRTFPQDNQILAYAQSASFVDYIKDTYGNRAITQMIGVVADGADCTSVVERALNISLDELYEDWLDTLPVRPALTRLWRDGGVWLLLLLLGAIAALLILRTIPGKQQDDYGSDGR